MRTTALLASFTLGLFFWMNTVSAVTPEQLQAADSGLLPSVAPEKVPGSATFYSWQAWWLPPLPFRRFPELTVFDLGGGRFLIDDRFVSELPARFISRSARVRVPCLSTPIGPNIGCT